jgi:prevent-host-death family protein
LVIMTIQMNVAEAKAKLSELLDLASRGDDVVIARAGQPVARLVPVAAPPPRTLGFLSIDVDDDLFAPLDPAEASAWE